MNVHDHQGIRDLLDVLGLRLDPGLFVPRFNVAPGMGVVTVCRNPRLELSIMAGGITPRWSTPQRPSRPLINARAEIAWSR